MVKGYQYTKAEAKRFISRTKSGLNKMFQSDYISANKFTSMCNDLDRMMTKLKK